MLAFLFICFVRKWSGSSPEVIISIFFTIFEHNMIKTAAINLAIASLVNHTEQIMHYLMQSYPFSDGLYFLCHKKSVTVYNLFWRITE